MRVVVHPEAGQELAGAALWHEERQPGLGSNFLDEFEATLRRVAAEPERWRKMRGDNRKLNFRLFPFAIVYRPRPGALYITAAMHLRRAVACLLLCLPVAAPVRAEQGEAQQPNKIERAANKTENWVKKKLE